MNLSISTDRTDEDGREQLLYGTREWPVAFFYDDLDIVRVPWHWHEELELILVLAGTEEVHAGDETFEVSAGDGYFINSGVLHSAEKKTDSCIQEALIFHTRLVAPEDSILYTKYVQPLVLDQNLPCVHFHASVEEERKVLDALRTAWKAGAEGGDGSEFRVRALLSEILLYLHGRQLSPDHETDAAGRSRSGSEIRVKRMLSFIGSRYMDPITIGEIAESANISVSECLRCFKKHTGTSPVQYLITLRLEKAAELLVTTGEKVAGIARRTGFGDAGYFARMFRKAYGVTPSAYRKLHTG